MDSAPTKYLIRENVLIFGAFLITVHLFYFKTWQSGFVTDFTGLQERLDGAPFQAFLTCFGFPALHQVTNFFLYIFYTLFGTSEWPWYLVHTSLHVVNGLLGYHLAKRVMEKKSHAGFSLPALMAASLFLLSPYSAEAVIWKVCFNFLFCSALMLVSLLLLEKYATREKRTHLLYAHLLFIAALFTFELALALPLMALALMLWWNPGLPDSQFIRKKIFPVTGIHLLLTGLYFILNKTFLGGWVGHYGEAVHLNLNPGYIASNCLKYFAKNLIYWREWSHGAKEVMIAFCDSPLTSLVFILSVITASFSLLFIYKKTGHRLNTILFSWLLFFLALAPVANLYVAWILHGENDRYGYFASLFFYMGLIALLQYFNIKIRLLIYAALLFISLFNLYKINTYWQNSTVVVKGLLDDFKWENHSEIFVLAFPENYKGIPMFKDFSKKNLALCSALKYSANKISDGKFYQVAQFNMSTPDDGLTASIDTTGTIHLEFHEWGSWWWRHGIGTGPYETDQYRFKPVAKGCEITIKEAAADAVFIYSDGSKWKEVFLYLR